MADSGTDETLAAPPPASSGTDQTLAASEQSLRPVSAGGAQVSRPDYGALVEVDPTHYALGDEVARGGMGRIVAARDRRLGRGVAIKQLLDTDAAARARFEREVRITARLQHPAIVHVHEAGRWPTGEPFYSMKLIAGDPLDRSIAKATTLPARLALLPNVIAVVDALAYAHSEGVIHRDLKPGNVLVGGFGETVVIDWGLAKDLRTGEDAAESLRAGPYRGPAHDGATLAGAVMGTPAYMPPEQAAGARVDERADVYALGALLYHVLAGAPPFEGATPAAVLAAVLAGPPRALASRDADIPVELVAIVEKAMAREPAARFANAAEMVGELKRFQMGQLVASHRYTRRELAVRWVRRHRAAVSVGSIAGVTLGVLAAVGIQRIVVERDRADHEAAVARARLDEATIERARQELEVDPTRALARLRQLSPGAKQWAVEARTIAADAAGRGISTRVLPSEDPGALVFSPDGAQLAVFEQRTHVRVWNTTTWQAQTFPFAHPDAIAVTFASDGLRWVTTRGEIHRWTIGAPASELLRSERATTAQGYRDAEFGSEGRLLALFEPFAAGRLVDLQAGTVRPLPARYDRGAFSADGRTLIVHDASGDAPIDRLDLATGLVTPLDAGTAVSALAADDRHVWIAYLEPGRDGTYAIGELRSRLFHDEQPGYPAMLALLPDGAAVSATTTGTQQQRDDSVTVTWTTRRRQLRMRGHRSDVSALATSSTGLVASADGAGEVRIWRVPRPVHVSPPPPSERRACTVELPATKYVTTIQAAYRTPDRRAIVVVKPGPTVEIRDLAGGPTRRLRVTDFPPAHPPAQSLSCRVVTVGANRFAEPVTDDAGAVAQLAYTADGRHLATLGTSERRSVILWNLETGRARLLGVHAEATQLAIHPDGSEVVTFGDGATLVRWDTATRAQSAFAGIRELSAFAYAPDGRSFAGATRGLLFAMPREGPLQRAHRVAIDAAFTQLAYSADGSHVAAATERSGLEVWRPGAATTRALRGHTGAITSLGFSPDGSRLVSTSVDATVRVWNLADGTSQTLVGHREPVTSFELLDARRLVTTSLDGTARLFDVPTGASRALGDHLVPVTLAYAAGDGFVTLDQLEQVTQTADELPHDEAGLRRWLANATTVTLDRGAVVGSRP